MRDKKFGAIKLYYQPKQSRERNNKIYFVKAENQHETVTEEERSKRERSKDQRSKKENGKYIRLNERNTQHGTPEGKR
ncbi:MAG: hypothetical protein D6732_05425 [Methanobacteriota archaeon]|nr:MAG: hypothetical protein D6732_05425 [Euryarchaeota archaeon]